MSGKAHDLQQALEDTLHELEEHIPFYLRRWWRWPAIAIAAIVVPLAVGLLAFRLIAPEVPGYRAEVEQRASAVIGFPVAIDDMYLSWYWFGPEVVMRKVRVRGEGGGELFGARTVRVAISPLDFMRGGQWRPARVVFEQPVIALTITPDQRVLLGGTTVGDLTQPTADWRAALATLLTHGRIEVRGFALSWNDLRRLDGPLAFTGELAIETDGARHALELEVALPAVIGSELVVEGTAEGAPGTPESWRWDARLRGRDIEVGWLRDQVDAVRDQGFDGELDIEAAATATGLSIDAIDGKVRMGDLRAAGAPRAVGESIDALETGFDWRRDGAGWRLELQRLLVRRGTRVWQPGGITLAVAHDDAGGSVLSGDAGFLRVEDLELIASWLPTRVLPIGQQLRGLAPRGSISGFHFALTLADGTVHDYEIRARFEEFGFAAVGAVPGAVGLSGTLDAHGDRGTLVLDARQVSVDFGDLFRGPLGADTLGARLTWSRAAEGWRLQGDGLRLRNPDIRAQGRMSLLVPVDGSAPVIDLELQIQDAVSRNLRAYLPVRVMSANSVAWLEQAIVTGRAPHGEIIVQGPLDRFPYRDGSGLFQIKFHADDAILNYAEGWPRIEGIVADATFRNTGLEIVAAHATVGGATSHQARAWIPDLMDPVVYIEGHLAATAEQGQWFIANCPLRERLSTYVDAIKVEGPMDVRLALEIPVRVPDGIKVDVRANFAGAKVRAVGFPLVAEEVSGEARFTQDSLSSESITGRLFGAPFTARIVPPPKGVEALARLTLEGGAEVKTLARALQLPLDQFMNGRTALHADVDLPHQRGGALQVGIRTDLKGIAVDLPPPFGKAAATATLTRAALRFGGDALGVRVELAGGSTALYGLRRESHGWVLAPGESAAHVSVVAPLVDLDAWLAEWSTVLARPDPRPARAATARAAAAVVAEPPLRRLDVKAKRLLFVGSSADDATLTARRDGPAWQAEVASSTIAGSIAVPDDRSSAPIVLDMERLWIAEGVGGETVSHRTAPDPRTLPGFEVRAASLRLYGADLGKVEATIERRPTGLFLTRFDGKALTHTIDATGRWEQVDGAPVTAIKTKLVSSDLRVTLSSLGIAAPLEAERGRIVAEVAWPGAPWDEPFAHMGGKLELRVGTGQLVELAPGGAGRLVGLMSLSALPRRLRLDFSDVWGKGLGFDSIEGDFVIEQGNAFTDGTVISGPAAKVTIVGRAGLNARDYDQVAEIETGFSSTLPVAGAIAGGLTGGAVMLLIVQMFKSPLKDATRARYRITGPWADPKIERVSKAEPPRAVKPNGVKP